MNRVVTLILIAGVTFLLILLVNKPDLLENVWLWLVGLSGSILQAFKSLIEYFKEDKTQEQAPIKATPKVGNPPKDETVVAPIVNTPVEDVVAPLPKKEPLVITNPYPILPERLDRIDDFDGVTLTLLRSMDDGETTIGWLYLDGEYFCYTLEDTYRAVKIKHETRIPSGTFTIDFNRYNTGKTKRYKQLFPSWFTYHLHLKNVPNYDGIYIHIGGDYTHTSGCILVSDSLVVTESNPFFDNSKATFERLYKVLSKKIEAEIPVRIVIIDEQWTKDIIE